MMHFNKEVDYGLLLIASLAEEPYDQYKSLSEISQKKHMPYRFLGKIITPLRKAGIVESTKGVKGGYRLAKSIESLKLADVLAAYGEDYAPVKCLKHDDNDCQSKGFCTTKSFWEELHEQMGVVINKYSVKDFINK